MNLRVPNCVCPKSSPVHFPIVEKTNMRRNLYLRPLTGVLLCIFLLRIRLESNLVLLSAMWGRYSWRCSQNSTMRFPFIEETEECAQ